MLKPDGIYLDEIKGGVKVVCILAAKGVCESRELPGHTLMDIINVLRGKQPETAFTAQEQAFLDKARKGGEQVRFRQERRLGSQEVE